MAAIDIPDAYWTIQPRGFAAMVDSFKPAFDGVAVDVAAGAVPVTNGNDLALRSDLASADGDRTVLAQDIASEMTALVTTPTGDVVAATAPADGKTAEASASGAASAAFVVSGIPVQEPPYPSDDSAPPAPPANGPGDTPGQPAPPDHDPNAPPPPLFAELNALYEELLGRAIDDGGLATWTAAITLQGHDLEWVREQIMASPEYQNRQAPPPAAPDAPPIDTSQFVTHDQLAQVIETFDPTINLWV